MVQQVTPERLDAALGDTAPASAAPTPRKPLLLVLVGIPGSGKSTLSARLREQGWAIVSQDVLGDRRSCEAATARHLREGRNTVIDRCSLEQLHRVSVDCEDVCHFLAKSTGQVPCCAYRCNFDARQRATWLQVGRAACNGPANFVPVTLRLATDFAECRRRVLSRTDHPTLNAGPDSTAIIDR